MQSPMTTLGQLPISERVSILERYEKEMILSRIGSGRLKSLSQAEDTLRRWN